MQSNGITIESTSNAGKLTFQVKVLIPKEKLDNITKIHDSKKKLFDFDFLQNKSINNDLIITFNGKYKSNNSGINTTGCVTFERHDEYYHVKLRIWPNLYVPSKIKKKNKRLKQKNDRYSAIKPFSPRKATSSKFTNYKGNNSQNPFSGGSVTPK